jgi:pimeloyl-ACP methyl ester carboxylesterase
VLDQLGIDIASAPALPTGFGVTALETDLPWLDGEMARRGARYLVAHSYGALLALRSALANPERLDGLVLCEPIAWGLLRAQLDVARRLAELQRACLDADDPVTAMRWLVDFWNGAGSFDRLPERARSTVIAGAPRTRAEVAAGAGDRTSEIELARLRVPTLVLCGQHSPAESRAVSSAMAAALGRGTLAEVAAAGHGFPRSHPAETATLISSWFRQSARTTAAR